MHPDYHMYHTLKLWAKSFLSFTDANHMKAICGPCSLEVPIATSVEIQKLDSYAWRSSPQNILHGFISLTSAISLFPVL